MLMGSPSEDSPASGAGPGRVIRSSCGIHGPMAVCRAGGISSLLGVVVDNADWMVDDNSVVAAALSLLLALELSVPTPP
eukprot:gene17701-biopygen6823